MEKKNEIVIFKLKRKQCGFYKHKCQNLQCAFFAHYKF